MSTIPPPDAGTLIPIIEDPAAAELNKVKAERKNLTEQEILAREDGYQRLERLHQNNMKAQLQKAVGGKPAPASVGGKGAPGDAAVGKPSDFSPPILKA